MISIAAGAALAVVSAASIRYLRYSMSDLNDGAPSSTEPQTQDMTTQQPLQEGGAAAAGEQLAGLAAAGAHGLGTVLTDGSANPAITAAAPGDRGNTVAAAAADPSPSAGQPANSAAGSASSMAAGSGEQGNGAASGALAGGTADIYESASNLSAPQDGSAAGAATADLGNAAAAAAGQSSGASASGAADLPNVGAGMLPAGIATPASDDPSASQAGAEVATLGEPAGDASAPPGTESSGTISETTDTSSTQIGETQTDLMLQSLDQLITKEAGTATDQGNAAGQPASADSAMPDQSAPLSPATADAVATFADLMMDRFETRHYADGTIMRTVGALPEASPVSYPERVAPEDNSPHGLLNQIEKYFTTALRSSRTDGHKLIALLREQLSQQ